MKTIRGISGMYFRVKRADSDKYQNIVFEDLTEQEQDDILATKNPEFVKGIAKGLANTINEIAEHFKITTIGS